MTLASATAPPIELVKHARLSLLDELYWTENAYLTITELNHLIELSEGRLVAHDIPTRQHQEIVGNVYTAFRAWIQAGALGHIVLMAPYPIRLWPGKFREPDIALYMAEHAQLAGEQHGSVPDLVVEVLSPGTRHIDMGDKFDEYAMAGIREYWLLDPETRTVQVNVLTGDRYTLASSFSQGQTIRSNLLTDFQVRFDELLT